MVYGVLKAALKRGDGRCEKAITFIIDRSKGLINAIATIFPGLPYVYCLRLLKAIFYRALINMSKSTREDCGLLVKRITFAFMQSEYNAGVDDLAILQSMPISGS